MSDTAGTSLRIVVAGASGFIGIPLLRRLAQVHQVIALTRSHAADSLLPLQREPGIFWVKCDLLSLKQTEEALYGADAAFFLVHSMMPAARLTQGSYKDLDLLIADNFSRASERSGVGRIVYLGGIRPDAAVISEHLKSRLEVESVLRSRNSNMVALRAGLVLGADGSSSRILIRLVKRLPVLICPSWTTKISSPVALEDTVLALQSALNKESILAGSYDLAGPEQLSYRALMQRTAEELNLKRLFIPVPAFSPSISRLWVSVVTGSSRELVAPLVQSLLHDMVPGKTAPLFPHTIEKTSLVAALGRAELPRVSLQIHPARHQKQTDTVRKDTVVSIQRMRLPQNWSARDVAHAYSKWLAGLFKNILKLNSSQDGSHLAFHFMGMKKPLLILEFIPARSDDRRALFFVTGGLLRSRDSHPLSRLEFRTFPDEGIALACVLDFTPALPWFLYRITQAQAHLFIMTLFARYLRKIANKNTSLKN
ncbi:MAG: hypothetical protein RIR26_1280 [Pseudomonadota bacterium]|jgi:uncharacterized protein YbjT (DUF2867 family)